MPMIDDDSGDSPSSQPSTSGPGQKELAQYGQSCSSVCLNWPCSAGRIEGDKGTSQFGVRHLSLPWHVQVEAASGNVLARRRATPLSLFIPHRPNRRPSLLFRNKWRCKLISGELLLIACSTSTGRHPLHEACCSLAGALLACLENKGFERARCSRQSIDGVRASCEVYWSAGITHLRQLSQCTDGHMSWPAVCQ